MTTEPTTEHVPSCNDGCIGGTHLLLADPVGCVHHWVPLTWDHLRCVRCRTVCDRIGADDG
jgi:hypothetical protein